EPTVLIYHTHATESYTPQPGENWRVPPIAPCQINIIWYPSATGWRNSWRPGA
ncbi:MAG: stage II sporulation protein P, partial [Oscillospiraceae bacterium]|nr:stage II sporulation protein P [Oscillospiraceae bacterium]